MAGLYFHIPFCRRKCAYCNFFSLASLRYASEFTNAIVAEIKGRKDALKGVRVDTVYFGGGTPSLLNTDALGSILNTIQKDYSISSEAEITMELNPDDISMEKLISWKAMGINRLSIGIQSFHPEDLDYLGRTHNMDQALEATRLCKVAGFSNLSIDLIYGIPGQDEDRWKENLSQFLNLGVAHLSAYALTLEEKTKYWNQVKKGERLAPPDEMAFQHFMILNEVLSAAGFEHYEISNLAKAGHYSRHNTAYWQNEPYLGFGPSAHSFDGISRSWNVSNLGMYIKKAPAGEATEGSEYLSRADHLNEYIMTSLRTMWGCDKQKLELLAGKKAMEEIQRMISHYILKSWVKEQGNHWVLSPEGMFHADGIASALFMDEEDF